MNFKSIVTFHHVELENGKIERTHQRQVNIDGGETWMKLIKEYAQFLSGVYGYDIVDQIEVQGESLNDYS